MASDSDIGKEKGIGTDLGTMDGYRLGKNTGMNIACNMLRNWDSLASYVIQFVFAVTGGIEAYKLDLM